MMNKTITTDKEAFEYVSQMLLEQGTRSMDDASNCQYRGFKEETMDEALEKAEDIARKGGEDYWNEDIIDLQNELLQEIGFDAKCAVGHLISDAFYRRDIEGDGISNNPDIFAIVKKSNTEWGITDNSFHMLTVLQHIHDSEDPIDWENCFNECLDKFTEDGKWIINE